MYVLANHMTGGQQIYERLKEGNCHALFTGNLLAHKVARAPNTRKLRTTKTVGMIPSRAKQMSHCARSVL